MLIETLWDEGCVYYARTAQPQLIMHLETNSNVYGRTVNPYNRNLTPGGSSGGESALLGMRGSILVSFNNISLLFLTPGSDSSRVLAAILAVASAVQEHTLVFTRSSKKSSVQKRTFEADHDTQTYHQAPFVPGSQRLYGRKGSNYGHPWSNDCRSGGA